MNIHQTVGNKIDLDRSRCVDLNGAIVQLRNARLPQWQLCFRYRPAHQPPHARCRGHRRGQLSGVASSGDRPGTRRLADHTFKLRTYIFTSS